MAYLRSSRSILTRESDTIDAAVVNDEPLDNVESEGTLEVTDVIAAEEAEAEVAELNGAIEAENEVIEENQEVAEELEEVSEANETLINEAPEQVTPEQVVAAEQAFVHAIGRARLNRKEMMEIRRSTAVSFESASASPLQALRVTQEGIKDFLRNLWDQIKTLIAKVIGAIQKLFQKAKLLFINLDKKAKALKSKADKLTGNVKVDAEKATDIFNVAPFFFQEPGKGGGKAYDVAGAIEAMKFATLGNIVNKIAAKNTNIQNFQDPSGIVKIVTDIASDFKTKWGSQISTLAQLKTYLSEQFDAQMPIGKVDEKTARGILPWLTDGKKIWAIVVSPDSSTDDDGDVYNNIDFNVITINFEDLGVSSGHTQPQSYTKAELQKDAENILRAAKDLDKVVDGIRRAEDTLKKIADNAIKSINKNDNLEGYEKVNNKIIARTVQICATKVSLAAVNAYVNGVKNLTQQLSMKLAKASDNQKNNKSASTKED